MIVGGAGSVGHYAIQFAKMRAKAISPNGKRRPTVCMIRLL
jgi:NADPH:quinone reductase-like Zn-dependent oxidoreductase